MLAVILKILSIIGIVLLCLLCFVLFLLLLVLFMPFVYKIDGKKSESALSLTVKVRWLFGLIRARYAYPDPGKAVVKILCFTVFDSGNTTKPKDTLPSREKDVDKSVSDDLSVEASSDEKESLSPEQNHMVSEESIEEECKKSFWEKLLEKYEKIKYTIKQICDKIKHILENITFYKDLLEDEDTQLLISHGVKRVGKIIRHIRPRKLKADVIFGTGSPDTTGYAYAIYGMFSPKLGKNVCITPDFEQKILLGSISASGHITVFSLLVNILAVVLDRRLRMLLSRIKAHSAKITAISKETNNQ